MSEPKPANAAIHAASGTPECDLLELFTGRSRGFQVSGHSSYSKHEQWRSDVFRGLKLLEAEGFLVVHQLVPCQRHWKCGGQPVAAGCELTQKGLKTRNFSSPAVNQQ